MRFQLFCLDVATFIRRIRRRPRRFLHLILILAVGLGCVVGIFDVAYGMLHTPLPTPHPDRIVVATTGRSVLFSYDLPNPHMDTVFESAAEFNLFDTNLLTDQSPKRIRLAMVSPQFFSTLGVVIPVGHDFSEYKPSGSNYFVPRWLPIVVSHELWRGYFGSNEAIVNHWIELNLSPYHFQVVGVAPPYLNFPPGVDGWIPVHLASYYVIQTAGIPRDSGGVVGLLKPGLSASSAEARIRDWPDEHLFERSPNESIRLVPLREFRGGALYRLGVNLWLASIFFMVLTALAAMAVLEADVEARRGEFAIRMAVGASPGRLLHALGLEAGTVVLAGLLGSFVIRIALIRVTQIYISLPKDFDARITWTDLAMAAGTAAVVFVGALLAEAVTLLRSAPAFSAWRRFGTASPKSSSKPRSDLGRRFPVQVIPATLILIVSVLLIRSAYKLVHVDPHVQPANVFVCEVSLPFDFGKIHASKTSPKMSPAERNRAAKESDTLLHDITNAEISEVVNTMMGTPDVAYAGAISAAPYRGNFPGTDEATYSPTADGLPGASPIQVAYRSMTPGTVAALGMRLIDGRGFTGDAAEDKGTVIINEALAEMLGGASSMGGYLKLTGAPSRIVGVVNSVHEQDLASGFIPTVYLPFSEGGVPDVDLVVRTSRYVPSADVFRLIQTSVRSASPEATVSHFETLTDMVESASTLARYSAYYLLALAILSVVLSALCASAKAFADLQRRKQEIGIRMALGATVSNIIRLFVYSDLKRTLVAVGFGVLLAWWFARTFSYFLYGVNLLDPVSDAAGALALVGLNAIAQVVLLRKALQESPHDLMSGSY